MVALLVLLTILCFLTVDYLVQRRQTAAVAVTQMARPAGAVSAMAHPAAQLRYRTPSGVFFDPGHTWLFLEESGSTRIGINDFAQSIIGKIDSVKTRALGDRVQKGDVLLKLLHGDRTATFRAPIDGVIEEVNTELLERHEMFGAEPFSSGWVYRIKPSNTSVLQKSLLLGESAKDWLSREVQRLKVILATVAPANPVLGQTLQDGGLPAYGLIDFLSEPEWKQIQEKFFD